MITLKRSDLSPVPANNTLEKETHRISNADTGIGRWRGKGERLRG